jgi:hypothetical protein
MFLQRSLNQVTSQEEWFTLRKESKEQRAPLLSRLDHKS